MAVGAFVDGEYLFFCYLGCYGFGAMISGRSFLFAELLGFVLFDILLIQV